MLRTSTIGLAASVVFASAVTGTAHAHINMLKPTSWLKDDAAGGAQEKGAPCGPGGYDFILGNTDTPSGVVTTFNAGETITVEWRETIAHPGYFRIALAENRADLEDPTVPFTDASMCNVDHTKIPTGAHGNVLADGILIQKPDGTPARPGAPNYSFQVKLPDKPCEKCTLQLIQFMENHPPDCGYYHCADIKIVAGAATGDAGVTGGGTGATGGGTAGAADAGAPDATSPGSVGGTTGGGATTGGGSTVGGGGAVGGVTTAGGGTASGGTPGGAAGTPGGAGGALGAGPGAGVADGGLGTTGGAVTATAGGTTPSTDDDVGDDGCDCAVSDSSPRYGNLIGMSVLALCLLARRRRLRS